MRLTLRILVLVSVAQLGSWRPAAADVSYVYDDLGRLHRVFDGQGEGATYVYDAVGNIIRILRHSEADARPSVTPASHRGAPGHETVLTIRGAFLGGAQLTSPTPDVAVTMIGAASDTEVTARITVAPTATVGVVTLSLGTPAGVAGVPVTIAGVTAVSAPAHVIRGVSTTLTFTANTDLAGLRLTTDRPEIEIGGALVDDASATAVFTTPLDAALDPVTISFALPDISFTTAIPVGGISVEPPAGGIGKKVAALIRSFGVDLTGGTVSSTSEHLTFSDVRTSPDQIAVSISIAATAPPGPVRLLVNTPSGVRHQASFTLIEAPPVPFGIVNLSPPPGTPSASRTAPIVVQFSEPIQPATVTSQSLRVTDGDGSAVVGTLGVLPDGATVRFTAAVPFPSVAAIHVAVTTGIVSQGGATLSDDRTYAFTTAGNELFVDGTRGDDATGDGSSANPFASIGRAMSAASAGALVSVAPGTYQERVAVPTGVTLQGAGPDRTMVAGTDVTDRVVTAASGAAILSLGVAGGSTGIFADQLPLTIGGVAVTGQGRKSIEIATPDGVTAIGALVIVGTTVGGTGEALISVCCDTVGDITLSGLLLMPAGVFANGVVICCTGGGRLVVSGNAVVGSVAGPTARAFEVCCDFAELSLTGNVITDAMFGGVEFCCTVQGHVTVVANRITTPPGGDSGVSVCCDVAGAITVTDNDIRGMFEALSFCCAALDTMTIARNRVHAARALTVSDVRAALWIADNTITQQPAGFSDGIFVCCDLGGPITIERNTMAISPGIRICCTIAAPLTIQDNALTNGTSSDTGLDLCCDVHADVQVSRNTLTGFFRGVSLTTQHDAGVTRFEDNRVESIVQTGMELSSVSGAALRRNAVTGSGRHGVMIFAPAVGTGSPPDLGSLADPGENTFQGNGTSDPALFFDLANEAPVPLSAIGNRWDHGTAAEIDQLDIRDDEEGSLEGREFGAVTFEPFLSP